MVSFWDTMKMKIVLKKLIYCLEATSLNFILAELVKTSSDPSRIAL